MAGDTGEEPREGEGAATDRSLLRRFRGGEADASTLLYLRYAERLNALAARQSSSDLSRRVPPDEIVQSVFRTFFRRVVQGHYDVPDGEKMWKLLLVIALNKVRTAATRHRAAKRDIGRTTAGREYDLALETIEGRDETALTALRLVIDEILGGLHASRKTIIEMRIEGYEVAEIGEAVRRSKRSVERVLQEFRTRLGALIREDV